MILCKGVCIALTTKEIWWLHWKVAEPSESHFAATGWKPSGNNALVFALLLPGLDCCPLDFLPLWKSAMHLRTCLAGALSRYVVMGEVFQCDITACSGWVTSTFQLRSCPKMHIWPVVCIGDLTTSGVTREKNGNNCPSLSNCIKSLSRQLPKSQPKLCLYMLQCCMWRN